MIILDFGSGNTCLNDIETIKYMYVQLKRIHKDKNKKVVVKWQLFKKAGFNIPLKKDIFDFAYNYGMDLGYEITASVFDKESLDFLLKYDIPFVKIANNRQLDGLIKYIPKSMPIIISTNKRLEGVSFNWKINYNDIDHQMFCVSDYPASVKQYDELNLFEGCNISDHTSNFEIYHKYKPKIIEWHYKLDFSTGLDSGSFARTPEQLKNILGVEDYNYDCCFNSN